MEFYVKPEESEPPNGYNASCAPDWSFLKIAAQMCILIKYASIILYCCTVPQCSEIREAKVKINAI